MDQEDEPWSLDDDDFDASFGLPRPNIEDPSLSNQYCPSGSFHEIPFFWPHQEQAFPMPLARGIPGTYSQGMLDMPQTVNSVIAHDRAMDSQQTLFPPDLGPQLLPFVTPEDRASKLSLSEDNDDQSSPSSQASAQHPTPATSPVHETPPPILPRRTALPTRRAHSKTTSGRIGPLSDAVRTERDRQIIEGRQQGLSYRQIREMHNMPEADSTLRGRYRTLVKKKEERVRRPVWRERDVQLLFDAVQKADKPNKKSRMVKWKDVTEYMAANGASYPFSSLACKKKWEEEIGETASPLSF